MRTYARRFMPRDDLRLELNKLVAEKSINGGIILSGIGSLTKASIRLADGKIKSFEGPFEIISLAGTISQDGAHAHICLADKEGKVIGGHLKEGCIIKSTAEIMVAESDKYFFARKFDKETNDFLPGLKPGVSDF